MNIMELGAIGELVGGVAVIGSLLFVGLQVRQSNAEAQQRNQLEATAANKAAGRDYRELMLALTDPNMAGIFRKGLLDFALLTKDEGMQLNWWLSSVATHLMEYWFYDKTRLLDMAYGQIYVGTFVLFLKTPGGAQWWSEISFVWDPDFIQEIDELVRQSGSSPTLTDRVSWYLDDATQPEGAA